MAKKKGAKLKPMQEEEVVQYIQTLITDSVEFDNSELSEQRANSLAYYLGSPLGNEQEGKSQVVSRDVQETVDWIMPSLMKVFTSGDSVVQFQPQNEEDVAQAEQETEYINWVFTRKNPGFTIMHDWFQDALMMKNGIVKVYMEGENQPKFDYFTGITEDILLDIISDPQVEVLQQTSNGDGTFDIKVSTTDTKRHLKVCNVPPEEFIISRKAKSIEDALFCGHRPQITKSELREMGVPEDVIEGLQYDSYDMVSSAPEVLVRDSMDGSNSNEYHNFSDTDANSTTRLTECYVKLDVDGDGIAELRRIVIVGDYLISNEEAPCKPFADVCAHKVAHKFFGMSIYDKIKDIQEIRSVLMRNILDNIYTLNNGRYAVVEGQVNLDDLMTNQSGGIVRVKTQNAITDLPIPQLSGDVYNMLDRLEADRGKRTGVTDRSRGLDTDTLHSNQAATSVNQLMTAAEQQIDLIARMFAETGVKRLFQLLHEFSIKYQDQEEMFQLRGQFVKVNPANWRERYDLTIQVGIGNMNKDQQLIHIGRMFEMAQTVVSNGGLGVLVSEKNLYNMLKELTINAGFKDVNKYWTDPDSPEAMKAKDEKEKASQKPTPDDIKAQTDSSRAQTESQSKQADAQIRMAEVELKKQEFTLKMREASLKEAELELEREKFQWERARDEAEYQLEMTQARAVSIGDNKAPTPTKKRTTKASNT
jgi:hypothetical protein